MPGNHDRDDRSTTPDLETDGRFVSGAWRGFYIQWGLRGKQEMNLRFASGQITGDGADPGGEFSVKGTYDVDAGKVWMRKIYPSHVVEYDGHAEGETDGIWGNWQIRWEGVVTDKGGFHIWPDAQGQAEGRRTHAQQPRPTRREAEVFAGVGADSAFGSNTFGDGEPWSR